MKQSTYDIMCPHCGRAYNVPSQNLLAASGKKKRIFRCGGCQKSWRVDLNTTSSYGAYMAGNHPGETDISPQKDSWNVPPQPDQAQADNRPRQTAGSYWALFDRAADHRRSAPGSEKPIFGSKLTERLTDRLRKTRATSRKGLISSIRMPKRDRPRKNQNKGSLKQGSLNKGTPFSTEVRDSWSGSRSARSVAKQKTTAPRRKMAIWITSGVLAAGLSLALPLFLLGPPPRGLADDLPIKTAMEPTDRRATERANLALSVLAAEPELHASVDQGNRSHAKGHAPILIVSGTVINDSPDYQSGVLVEGRIFDEEGNILASTSVPCGVLHRHMELRQTPKEQIEALYKKNGKPLDCSIRRGRAKKYQLVFDQLPERKISNMFIKIKAIPNRARDCAGECSAS